MFTVYNLMELKLMENAKVLTPDLDLTQFEIKYISVIEPPVEDFIHSGDVVLSTALNCNDAQSFYDFFMDIYHSEPAALLLSFQDTERSIPQSLLDYANTHGMPVILLPWKLHFSTIIKLVTDRLQEEKKKEAEKYAELQHGLVQLFFKEKPLEKAISFIAEYLHEDLIILDRNKQEIFAIETYKYAPFQEYTIRVDGYVYGYLRIASAKDPTALEYLFESYLNIPLSLWFNKEKVINLTALRIKNDYVAKLADTTGSGLTSLLQQGVTLGFHLNRPFLCVLFKIINQSAANKPTDQLLEAHNLFDIENLLLKLAKSKKIETLLGIKEDAFLLYVPVDFVRLNHLLDFLETEVKKIYPKYVVFWGLGEPTPKKNDFAAQYKRAKMALEFGLHVKRTRSSYKESRISNLLFQNNSMAEIQQQAESFLSPIRDNLRFNEEGMDLIQTLQVYIQSNYNRSLTARKLNIHRQSLQYRLEKVESLIDCSLENHDDLFLLECYLRILYL